MGGATIRCTSPYPLRTPRSWTGQTAGQTNGVMGIFPADSNGSESHGPIFERDPIGNYTITVTGLTSRRTASAKLQVVQPGS